MVKTELQHESDTVFFGVFDGHGSAGTECAQFAKDRVRPHPIRPLRQEGTKLD